MSRTKDSPATLAEATRRAVDTALGRFFTEKRADVGALSPASAVLVDEIEGLTMRGGKRLRPIVLAAAHRAVSDAASLEDAVPVGAALELLQSYLLIHDDWMDGDLTRRGGPAVHASLRQKLASAHLGDAVGVLAGDLAGTWAWELVLRTPFPAHRRDVALAAYVRLQVEVYLGQHLDVVGDPDVPRMQDLKTGSYTVRGPLTLGALLGDARPEQLAALLAWGQPLGEAFQLRDDLLGTFGDPSATGKPGDDLRHGKETALLAEARRSLTAEDRAPIEAVLGDTGATDGAVARATEALVSSGVKARVEARLDALLATSEAALEAPCLTADGREVLRSVGQRLARRSA
jgi:geranylgeranyl diphosphate synthase type I